MFHAWFQPRLLAQKPSLSENEICALARFRDE